MTSITIRNPNHYPDLLEQAAAGYLRRHAGSYPLDTAPLLRRAEGYLSGVYNASYAQAQNAVDRAQRNLTEPDGRYLDVDRSTAHTAVFADPNTGQRWSVPVAQLLRFMESESRVQRFVESPSCN